MTRKLLDSLDNLTNAVANLERATAIPADRELVKEGTIQRFEVAIELTWKTLKRALDYEGIQTDSPRSAVREAFGAGWLADETAWLDMLNSRNRTSHQYLDEQLVDENYDDILSVTPRLRDCLDFLNARYAPLRKP